MTTKVSRSVGTGVVTVDDAGQSKIEWVVGGVAITPELAAEWLKRNTIHNRNICWPKVDHYAELIVADRWVDTPEGIAFDVDGNLINGQHRLHAIVKANKTVTMQVAKNCPRDAFKGIDIGLPRGPADFFTIFFKQKFGESPKNTGRIVPAASAASYGLSSGGHQQREVIALYALRHYKVIGRIIEALKGNHSEIYSNQLAGGFLKAWLYFGEEKILPLATRLGTEMWASEKDPLKALHSRLRKAKRPANRDERLLGVEKYAHVVSAIRGCLNKKDRYRVAGTEQDFGEAELDKRIKKD